MQATAAPAPGRWAGGRKATWTSAGGVSERERRPAGVGAGARASLVVMTGVLLALAVGEAGTANAAAAKATTSRELLAPPPADSAALLPAGTATATAAAPPEEIG